MRNKVLAVLATYSEGRTIRASLKEHSVSWQKFYRALREEPDLLKEYYERQEDRGEMAGDRLVQLTEELLQPPHEDENGVLIAPPDARNAHVAGNLLLKIMETYKPGRFSPKMQVQIEAKPNLVAAIESGRSRAALPSRDLHPIIDVQAVDITPLLPASAPDMQSEEGEIDPFS